MKNIFKVTFAYIAAVVGAGFASGSEAVLYFVKYGKISVFGVVLTGIGLGFFSYIILSSCNKYNVYSFDELSEILFGQKLSKFICAFLSFFMLIMLGAMISGSAELGSGTFGISKLTSSTLFCTICFFILLMDNRRIIKWGGIAGVFIVFFICLCSLYMINFRCVNVFKNLGNTVKSSLLYTSYNTFAVCPVLCDAAKEINNEAECKRVGLYSGIFSFFALFLIWCLIMVYYGKISLGAMPMLTLSARRGMKFLLVYSSVIFISILSSAVANAYGIYLKFKDNSNKKLTLVIIIVLGFLVSSFGFTNIVGKLYGVVGIVSGMFPIVFLLKKLKNSDILRKNKKNRVL